MDIMQQRRDLLYDKDKDQFSYNTESEDQRNARYKRDAEAIKREVIRTQNDGESYDDAFNRWKERDLKEQKVRDFRNIDFSGGAMDLSHKDRDRIADLWRSNGVSEADIKEGLLAAQEGRAIRGQSDIMKEKVDNAWTNFGEDPNDWASRGDYVITKDGLSKDKRLYGVKGSDGKWIRFNENHQLDPEGEYYLQAKGDKRKDGIIQKVDKALGTKFESWLDNSIVEAYGGVADMFTGGLATTAVGGSEFSKKSSETFKDLADKATFGHGEYVGYAKDAAMAVGLTAAAAGTGGVAAIAAPIAYSAGNITERGINAELLGYDYDWGKAAESLAIGTAAAFGGLGAANYFNSGLAGSLASTGITTTYSGLKNGFDSDLLAQAGFSIGSGLAGNTKAGLTGSIGVRLLQGSLTDQKVGSAITSDIINAFAY